MDVVAPAAVGLWDVSTDGLRPLGCGYKAMISRASSGSSVETFSEGRWTHDYPVPCSPNRARIRSHYEPDPGVAESPLDRRRKGPPLPMEPVRGVERPEGVIARW
jgi:hypothetical protein